MWDTFVKRREKETQNSNYSLDDNHHFISSKMHPSQLESSAIPPQLFTSTISEISRTGSIGRNMKTRRDLLWSSGMLLLILSVFFFSCSFASDPLSQDLASKCTANQFKCDCGVPTCIDKSLVNNGGKDCEDGSDEGQWDPSKCAIKNRTSEDIRFKRAAIPDFSRLNNGDATTTFFGNERGRTRPVGLLSTSLGAFVTSGTTTEYLTKVLGTYIKGTYARIISTSSKVYHAVPTDVSGENLGDRVRPTGFIASTTSTEINGYATTVHKTDYYRTYIDGTYAQLVSSSSNVQYPSWFTEQIDPSALTPDATASPNLISPSSAKDHGSSVYPTHLPRELKGNFVNNVMQSRAYAELGIVNEENRNTLKLKALRPNNNAENELRVTGTHGKFIHSDQVAGDETTYNVFTGSYIQNLKTFLFFFGNTVIDPTRRVNVGSPKATLMVENGPQKGNNVVVDMSQNLKVLVPSKNSRVMVDGSVGGQRMEGVVVEIEGSELGQDDLISVDGARATTPRDPQIDMITVTLDNNKETRVSSTSSSSSSTSGRKEDDENEIPQGRKIPGGSSSESIRLIRPSRTEHISLPTFTVGQPDKVEFQEDHSSTTPRVVVNIDKRVESSKSPRGGGGAPVFQKVTEKPIPRSTERIRALGYTSNKNAPRTSSSSSSSSNSKYSSVPNRNHRAFAGFDTHAKFNDVDSDLQSAASTGRATVTYVGFADFTTTVGNTVIVFMPRTKMIEDLSIHASKTETLTSPVVEPTRFVYQTDEETTTQRRPDEDDEHVQFSVSQVQQARKVPGSSTRVTLNDEDEETTTENINPSEPIRSVSGRETVFVGKKQSSSSSSSEIIPPEPTAIPKASLPKVRPSASASPASERRNSLFSSPRVKFTPKASKTFEPSSRSQKEFTSPVFKSPVSPSAYQTANTAVFQTDILNPTGLVTSVDGTIVREGKTTLYTSLVFGTFIGKSYAQVIKSTSRVVKSDASQIVTSPSSSSIRPTPVAKFTSRPSSSIAPVFTYEVTTTTEGPSDNDDEPETTTTQPLPKDLDRMEVSVSSTTESTNGHRKNNKNWDSERTTTTPVSIDLEDSFEDEVTTTTEKNIDDFDNEVGSQRVVQGKAKDQIIVDTTQVANPEGSKNEEEQTVYVTRTLPTTVFRTYTYYTTYFIPKEDTTLTSVVSREVTSSAVGLVRKTLTSIIPTASGSGDNEEATFTKEVEKPSSVGKYKSSRGKVQASGAQVIYKTLYTTYTYLTTFFSGQTSSVSSREETVSNVITVTSGIGSKATTSVKITPTGSSFFKSRSYKTASPRLSSAAQGGKTNVGLSSSPLASSANSKSSSFRRPKISSPVLPDPKSSEEVSATDVEYESVTKTLLRTFMTTYTYFTTLFNGDEASIKSRTEVITNVVPYVTKTVAPISPSASEEAIKATASPSDDSNQDEEEFEDDDEKDAEKAAKDEFSSSTAFRMSHNSKKLKETTFYTTYTYLSTIIRGKSSTIKTSKQTFTNVMIGDSTVRSGLIEPIEPTKLTGRSVGPGKATKSPSLSSSDDDDDEDLNEVGSHLSEASETTVKNNIKDEEEATTVGPQHGDYYELESSEGVGVTTDRPDHSSSDDTDDSNDLSNEKTPVLRTLFTTFTFYTTFYKGGTSTVSSRLETKSQVVTASAGIPEDDEDEVTVTDKAPLLSTIDPTYPVTYFTTYTYWTTSFKDGNSVVTSREETITNVVTPGAEDIAPSSSSAIKETENEILPTSSQEVELTTFYTTYTYFTTSYLGEKTIVNSRLETVTNVVTGVPAVTSASATPTPAGRAIGSNKPEEQKVSSQDKDEYQDYDLPTGLLSTIKSTEVNDRKTTVFSTDVFGTYIDGIYAQVLESTSNVITPTAAAETRFIPDATATPTGVVSVNEGKTVEANGDKTTFYATTAYGTVIDGKYAHLVESTSKIQPGATLEASEPEDSNQQRTGLVRIIDGTLVEGDHTTFYTSSILGTFIDGNYAQVIESTSRFVINPTKTGDEITTVGPTRTVIDVESSITESPQEDEETITTTTEKGSVEQEEEEVTEKPKKSGIVPPRRFGGLNNRNGRNGTRLSFTGTTKTFTPSITPFASRSRPGGFAPRKRPSAAVIATKTDDNITPTIASTPSGSSRGSFQSRRRFQKPGDNTNGNNNNAPVGDGTTTPTPALPASRTRGGSRFSKPTVGVGKSRFTSSSSAAISPTSAGSGTSGGSSPGARGRSSFSPRGSSVAGARGRGGSSSAGFVPPRPSSSAGFRGGAASSSRFLPGRGRSSVINPSSTQSTTPPPSQSPSLGPDEEEYEVEYEYETAQSSSSTTEAPKTTPSRFGGNNRFRLSPKLASPTTGRSTTTRPSTTRGSPLNLRRFSKPTLPTRGTTPAAASSSTTAAAAVEDDKVNPEEEYEEEYEEVSKEPSSTTTTAKPGRPGFGKKPIITQRPTSRPPVSRSRATTTGAPVAVQTTTRRIYTPRPRPAGFPRAVGPLTRSTTTTTAAPLAADEEYYEEGDFEYQESKNHANVSTIAEASSELSEVRVEAPSDASSSVDQNAPIQPEGDLSGSSSDIVEAILQNLPIADNANLEANAASPLSRRRRSSPSSVNHHKRIKRSHRQVYHAYYDSPTPSHNFNYNYNFGARTARGTLRSNFPSRPSSSSNSNSGSSYKSNPRSSGTNSNADYDYEYYYDDSPAPQSAPPPPPTTAAPAPSRQSPSARFRGRIQPTSSSSTNSNRRTPFTLTPNSNTNPRTPSRSRGSSSTNNARLTSNSNSNNNSPRAFIPTRRAQSRYQRPTEAPTTTSRTSRFRSRYNTRESVTTPAPISRGSSSNNRFGNTIARGRGSSRDLIINNNEPVFEPSTITVTHYVPAETQIPFVNGKSTEYKTVVTPSPSIEVLSPHQYTQSDYLGKPVLVLHSEMTSTPSFGVTEVTRYLVRESATTSVTFTPTTIRGRKTSFSHIIPSTVYSVEPIVSTLMGPTLNNNPLTDNSQLTNLLLNQLLGQGLLNPNQLFALQQQPGLLQQTLLNPNEPQTPITQYNTKTTSYVTTVTDFTSTIVKITLHGKPLKSTIVESSTHVITATEFITESTVITPTQVVQQNQQPLTQGLNLQQPGAQQLVNPALIQNLLASQLLQQQQLLQQPNPIVPTQPVTLSPLQLVQTQTPQQLNNNNDNKPKNLNEEESVKEEQKVVKEPPKPASSVVTLYVSGKNPGEFSTILQTVAVDSSRRKRSVEPSEALDASRRIRPSINPSISQVNNNPSISIVDSFQDSLPFDDFTSDYFPQDNPTLNNDNYYLSDSNRKPIGIQFDNTLEQSAPIVQLEDSYSYSDPFSNLVTKNYPSNNGEATESLESVLGDFSSLY